MDANPSDPPKPSLPGPKPFGRFVVFSVALPLAVCGVTVLVASLRSAGPLHPLAYVGWSLASAFLYFVFWAQNTIEAAVVLAIYGGVLAGLRGSVPENWVDPAGAACLAAWLTTRIHRRWGNSTP